MAIIVPFGRGQGADTASDSAPDSAIERLLELIRPDLEQVNRIILDKSVSEVEMIPELAHHLIGSGGKRLRPMMTLAAAHMCGYDKGEDHITLAAVIEFMHTATLLHDDVVDESSKRRGKPAARKLWGNEASVLVGDFLLGQAFRMMVKVGSMKVLDILSNTAAIIAEGEVMQLVASKNITTTEDAYMKVINAKTAELFAAAGRIGAVIAAHPTAARLDDQAAALESYGRNLGIAFQLVDDALDYSGDGLMLGKNVGDDFREGKITLAVVLAVRRGNDDERQFWQRTLQQGDQKEGDLEHAVDLLKTHGTLKDSITRARHYGAIAKDALAIFPESEIRTALIDVVDFCVERAY